MKHSEKRPNGFYWDWPRRDRQALFRLAYKYTARAKNEFDLRALEEICEELGIEKLNWLCDEVLALCTGCFYQRSGDHYATAKDIVQWMDHIDEKELPPEYIALAKFFSTYTDDWEGI